MKISVSGFLLVITIYPLGIVWRLNLIILDNDNISQCLFEGCGENCRHALIIFFNILVVYHWPTRKNEDNCLRGTGLKRRSQAYFSVFQQQALLKRTFFFKYVRKRIEYSYIAFFAMINA